MLSQFVQEMKEKDLGEAGSSPVICKKKIFPSEQITDTESRLRIGAFLFFLHTMNFSSLKFAVDCFWSKTHADLLQQVSVLETRHCSSLGRNVPFLCLCHARTSFLPDRITAGHNHLFRNMFYLNPPNPIMSEST